MKLAKKVYILAAVLALAPVSLALADHDSESHPPISPPPIPVIEVSAELPATASNQEQKAITASTTAEQAQSAMEQEELSQKSATVNAISEQTQSAKDQAKQTQKAGSASVAGAAVGIGVSAAAAGASAGSIGQAPKD